MNCEWMESSSWPALADGEAHVWLAYLPPARGEMDRLTELLSPEEVERAKQFRFDQHRERWLLARAILRSLLARYLETPAREIVFAHGPHGKPSLVQSAGKHLHFNTSHSGDYAAFAMTHSGEVGVDIEQVRADITRLEEIARRYFAPGEWKHLESLPGPERARAFFDCWTRKEAFVKARGDGLFSGLDQFEVSLTKAGVLSTPSGDEAQWSMAALPEIPGYSGAVVVKATACEFQFFRWTSS
jgi:4'-phosphopantetheinyl transferase